MLTANKNYSEILKQVKIFKVKNIIINDFNTFLRVKKILKGKRVNIYNDYNDLKKIFVKRCDIMFYRSNHIGKFSNFRKGHLKNYKQIVFTKVSNKSNKIQNDDCNFKEMLNRLKLKNYNFAYLSRDNSKLSPTTGFGVLENIIENVNYSKLVLVGFTNLTRETVKKKEKYGFHSLYNENKYFQNYILKIYPNIETIC